jgi:hypothetical protein
LRKFTSRSTTGRDADGAPATPEELAETDDFLRLRNLEHDATIAAEVGVRLNGTASAEPRRNPGQVAS